MNFDFSPALDSLEAMLNGLIAALPNVVVALLVFVLFFFIARGVAALVRRLAGRYQQHEILGWSLAALPDG